MQDNEKHKVAWQEGMLLRPQHFQQHDRYVDAQLRERALYLSAYGWGLMDFAVDDAKLAQGEIAITRATGILPDGTCFSIPEIDDPPVALMVSDAISETHILLGLADDDTVAEKGDSRAHARFVAADLKVDDNYAGSAGKNVTITIAKRRLRLFAASEEQPAGHTLMAVARVQSRQSDGAIVLDEDFIPPCLDCRRSPPLSGWLSKLKTWLDRCGQDLITRKSAFTDGTAESVEALVVLQTVNRYRLLIDHYCQDLSAADERQPASLANTAASEVGASAGGVSSWHFLHPETFYTTAIQLYADLATIVAPNGEPDDSFSYRHNHLKETFQPLMERLRQVLRWRPDYHAIELPVNEALREKGTYLVDLKEHHDLVASAQFIIMARISDQQRDGFQGGCRVCTVSDLDNVIKEIDESPVKFQEWRGRLPNEIPEDDDYIYYGLKKQGDYWEKFRRELEMAFYIDGYFPQLKLRVWAVKSR